MLNGNRSSGRLRVTLISAAVASCFTSTVALANPTGPTVVNGAVTIAPMGNVLQITNTPNAIINWQNFSIGAGELTRFIQQSSASAVLNRVITQNPSTILGALQSNGRVFLINPNGILFGAGSQIDVAGLVASTLNLSDTDFLSGRLRFTEVPGAGSVVNQGSIATPSGGNVYLVGPAVTNSGIITSPQGEVILAAGNSVELVDPGTPNLRVEITAPDNQALNLGQIIADSGRIGIYAGLINQSGVVQANTAVVTEDGRIVLKATKGVTLEAGSVTQASGARGGEITVETETGTIRVAGQLDATGTEAGGAINISVTGATGGIDLGTGLNAGNASVSVSGPGSTTTLNADIITAGANITINDSVILGVPASITLDTTNSGAVASGANITITGATNDDATPSGLVLRTGTGGANTLGGAVGNTAPIASLMTSGNTTAINGGLVNTTGNQTYNGAVTLGTATTLAATGPAGNIAINSSLSGFANSLTMNAGRDITVGGNVFSGPQWINAAGDITVTPAGPGSVAVFAVGPQTVSAGGALSVQAAAIGANRFAQFTTTSDQNISASSISITGGGGSNNFAQVNHQAGASGNQTITVNNGGTLALQGGLEGTDNFARISNFVGNQNIGFPAAGAIVITGGNGPNIAAPGDTANNFARIESRNLTGTQTIDTGTIILNGGLAGVNNFTGIQAAHQVITTTGNVTLHGGPAEISGSRIGAIANTSPTDLVLNVGGNLTLTGGSATGGSIGSNREGGQPTDIRVVAAGNVTLNPGSNPGANPRIGSPSENIAGGNIFVGAGAIALNSAGLGFGTAIRTTGNVTLLANSITQGTDSSIVAGSLGVGTINGASLGGANQVSLFSLFNSGSGNVLFNNASPLLSVAFPVSPFTAISQVSSGALTLNQTGDLAITGNVFSGPQSINVTGNMVLGSPNNSVNVSATGIQSVNVGGVLTLQGAAMGSNRFARLSATGDQTITASGITLTGGGGSGNSAEIRQLGLGSSQVITINNGGTLELQGGSGVTNNFARIRNEGFSQQVDFTSGGALVLTGGSGVSSDFAHLRANAGTQTITGSPTIELTGGTGGLADAGNNAQIRASVGLQTINAGPITLTAGASDVSNNAIIQSPTQVINIDGDLTLTGGGSASGLVQGGVARIGGIGATLASGMVTAPPGPTNLTLDVTGNVSMTGGSLTNAVIGSSTLGGTAPSDITMTVGGNVTLDPGAGGGARIGSGPATVVGGNISVAAGGNIALNSAGPGLGTAIRTTDAVALQANAITQGADAQIVADTLTTNTASGANMPGTNQVSAFNATNTTSGAILLNNTSPLLTVTGIGQVPSDALTLNQTGDLTFAGNVNSGPQSISATGDITVIAGSSTTLSAAGSQTLNAGGMLLIQGGASSGGSASIIGNGPVNVSTGGDLSLMGGSGQDAYALLFSNGDINLTVGGALRLNAGSGELAWARVQTATRDTTINIFFPNLSSGGFFVNDFEGALRRGETGLLSGNGVAVPDHTLIIEYGQ